MLSTKKSKKTIKWLLVLAPFIVIIATAVIIVIVSNKNSYSQPPESPEIMVVSPADGSVFEPGETITVVVEPITGISLKDVMVTDLSSTTGVAESEPFNISVTLPNKIGPIVLKVFARNKITEEAYTTELTLNLETTATLQEIILYDEDLSFDFYLDEQSLFVMGKYSDGIERDITSSSTGTIYNTLSGTENVVKISPDGLVTAQGNGQETIIINNSGVTKTIPVTVQATNSQPKLTPIGDLNMEAGTILDIPLSATDLDENDIVFFTDADSLPAFAQILDNGDRTGMLHIAPAATDTGTFSSIYISAIDKGNPSLGDTEKITITVTAPVIPGDLDGDGCVDRTDYSLIISDIRGPEPHNPSYDLNGDGAVNIADARKLVTLFTNPRGAPCE